MMSSESATSGCDAGVRGPLTTVSAVNHIQEPAFNIAVEVEWEPVSAQKLLEKAADKDLQFRFTATYFDKKLGYFINDINGVGDPTNKSYWRFTNSSGVSHDKGISNYWPAPGEEIRFIFTPDESGNKFLCNNALALSWPGNKA